MAEQSTMDEIFTRVKEYARVEYELLRLQLVSKIASAGASITTILILAFVISLTIIFLSVAAGFYLSALFESRIAGFLCVGGFYLAVTIILYIFRDRLLRSPVKNKLISEILKPTK